MRQHKHVDFALVIIGEGIRRLRRYRITAGADIDKDGFSAADKAYGVAFSVALHKDFHRISRDTMKYAICAAESDRANKKHRQHPAGIQLFHQKNRRNAGHKHRKDNARKWIPNGDINSLDVRDFLGDTGRKRNQKPTYGTEQSRNKREERKNREKNEQIQNNLGQRHKHKIGKRRNERHAAVQKISHRHREKGCRKGHDKKRDHGAQNSDENSVPSFSRSLFREKSVQKRTNRDNSERGKKGKPQPRVIDGKRTDGENQSHGKNKRSERIAPFAQKLGEIKEPQHNRRPCHG